MIDRGVRGGLWRAQPSWRVQRAFPKVGLPGDLGPPPAFLVLTLEIVASWSFICRYCCLLFEVFASAEVATAAIARIVTTVTTTDLRIEFLPTVSRPDAN
jgi:hypothetical protein